MARGIHRLTAAQVRNAKTPGMVHDGAGLFLQVTYRPERDGEPAGVTKSWLLRYTAAGGNRRDMGLGSADAVSLADARTMASAALKLLRAGVDPIDQRKADRAASAVEAARAMSFREAAEAYMTAQSSSWKSVKHAKLWAASLEAYVYPALGALPVAAVDVTLVLRVLEPVWREKPETGSRIRQRIEAVLDWAAARGCRSKDNPARWREHLQHLLPSRAQPVKHHPALPFERVGAFMADLRNVNGLGAAALELCILTATRTTETLKARWSEFDLDAGLWVIPPDRMKAKREHRVPLPRQAVAMLRRLRAADPKGALVFPGQGTKTSLSGMAMLAVLKRMKRTDITTHGFRSSFRDWAGEMTNFPREVAEQALAHSLKDKTEAAYRRGDALEKRRQLMQAWADYCDHAAPVSGAVIPMRRERGEA